ncbi:MAG: hypothetical protein U0P30_00115 [Vicinamibacterales bacterium]
MIVVIGDRISAVGPRASTPVPPGATVIDAAGKFVMPGMVDTNVHLSLYGGVNDRYETLVRYNTRQPEIVLEGAQLQLKHGITTVRDSYGMLLPLVATRDRIERGEAVGARILAAGNIVGWGGPYSISFALIREAGLTLFQEQMNDQITQGAGEDLVDMTPDELRVAITQRVSRQAARLREVRRLGALRAPRVHRLLARGAARDGGGSAQARQEGRDAFHHARQPAPVGRGRYRRHPASRAARSARIAGRAFVQIVDKRIYCSMLVNTITGDAWEETPG